MPIKVRMEEIESKAMADANCPRCGGPSAVIARYAKDEEEQKPPVPGQFLVCLHCTEFITLTGNDDVPFRPLEIEDIPIDQLVDALETRKNALRFKELQPEIMSKIKNLMEGDDCPCGHSIAKEHEDKVDADGNHHICCTKCESDRELSTM